MDFWKKPESYSWNPTSGPLGLQREQGRFQRRAQLLAVFMGVTSLKPHPDHELLKLLLHQYFHEYV